MLRNDDDRIADSLHRGIVVAGQHKDKIAVYHFTLVIICKEVSLTAQCTGVLCNVIKSKFDVFGSKWCSIAPGMSLNNFKAESHPICFGNSDFRTLQKLFLGFFDRRTCFIITKYDGFPFALFLPFFFGGIKVFIAIDATLCFRECTLYLHQAICKGQRVLVEIHWRINGSIGEGVNFSLGVANWCRCRA